jgi:outer membrane protein OmpA-like peptidoglycan-associated protein
MRHRFAVVFTGILALSLSLLGCSQPALNVKPIAKTENPSALLGTLAGNLSAAKEKRVDLLSPTWFAKAQASYAKAKAQLDQGAELSKILANIANGRAQLAQASGSADKAAKYLASAIKSRDAALAAGADRYKKTFADLEDDFHSLTKAVEEDDLGYVRKKRKVVDSQYRELELRAIKDDHLGEVRRLMQVAASEDMDEAAPKSYLVAQSKLADAEKIIAKDRYDKAAIDKAVGQARFYAQRLHQLAAISKKLEKMTPEAIALWMEGYLAQTNAHLYESDRRNLPFKDQQEVIIAAISTLQRNQSATSSLVQSKDREIEKLKQRIDQLEGRTYQERADKERLEAEKRFNEIYTRVQGYFSADQAEVYKKAQYLVIRLKAMRFPVGQAVVVSSNYPLLTTVRKAIQAFGRPDVVIEGHTDSTGSEALNQKLSRSRAESVRQYLIQNGTLPADKITAKGYGSSRPLASNATARGRAVNRRIDVIIKPVR